MSQSTWTDESIRVNRQHSFCFPLGIPFTCFSTSNEKGKGSFAQCSVVYSWKGFTSCNLCNSVCKKHIMVCTAWNYLMVSPGWSYKITNHRLASCWFFINLTFSSCQHNWHGLWWEKIEKLTHYQTQIFIESVHKRQTRKIT